MFKSTIAMAHIKTTPQEFIREAFPPMIAVMHTPGVDDVCKKNNLNFIQLIKPFSKTTVESTLKDTTSGFHIPIRNLKIAFSDINARPPPPAVARSYFNHSISSNFTDRTTRLVVGDDSMDVPVSAPWFEAWRDTFLQVQYPSEHEFTKHFIGCLIVISSVDTNPLEKLEELLEILQGHLTPGPNKLPKWFGPSLILTAFLYLHDNSVGALDVSVFEAMKVTYGINKCFLLSINSQAPGDGVPHVPDPWTQHISSFIDYKDDDGGLNQEQAQVVEAAEEAGEKSSPSTPVIIHPLSPVGDGSLPNTLDYISESEKNNVPEHGKLLSPEDIDRIKQVINDFCVKALIPHFEQLIHQLSDQISNKKGVSRSLFSATKRWFGSNKPGTPGNHISPTAIAYSSDSHELQLRKLGDLCFMVGLYSLAFTAYHSAKRDFGADGAWLHYAGALEMAALSAFMSNSDPLSRKVVEYAEESILTYQNSCRMNQFATRATLLSVECLKARGLFGEAAKQLIRMSGEDSDLRSAVLLEQAAYCFLSNNRPIMHRKYAFHMVLAGHRYSKASHRNHSMRCYYQAYQIYSNKSWCAAEDHILYTIGKHASHLKLANNAFEALSRLVTRPSKQPSQQQEIYLKDYLLSIQQSYQKSDEEVILSLPVIDSNLIQVALNVPTKAIQLDRIPACDFSQNALSPIKKLAEESMWHNLEERISNYANGTGFASFMLFKPMVDLLSNHTDNVSTALGFIGVPIGVCVSLKNPLNVQINLTNIVLLWTVIPENSGICEDSSYSNAAASSEPEPELSIPPDSTRYIMLMITPKQVGELHITGLSYTLHDPVSDINVFGHHPFLILKKNIADRRLQISVIANVPHLEVCFSGLKKEFISREIHPFNVHLKNTGSVAISKIFFTTSENFRVYMENHESEFTDQIFTVDLVSPLAVNDTLDLSLFSQPIFEGYKNFDLLFYYESVLKNSKPSYRLVKHSWPTVAYSNIKILTTNVTNAEVPAEFKASEDEKIIRFHLTSNLFNSVNLHNLQIECVTIVSKSWRILDFFGAGDMKIIKGKELHALAKIIPSDTDNNKYRCLRFTKQCCYIPPWGEVFVHEAYSKKNENFIQFSFSWSVGMVSMEEGMRKAYGQDYVWVLCEDRFEIPAALSDLKQPISYPISPQKKLTSASSKDIVLRVKIYETPHLCRDLTLFGSQTVPITVDISNDKKQIVRVNLSFLPLLHPSSRDLTDDSTSDSFTWLGRIEYKELMVGKEKVIVNVAARISGPGAYDVSKRVNIEAFDNMQHPVASHIGDCVIVIN